MPTKRLTAIQPIASQPTAMAVIWKVVGGAGFVGQPSQCQKIVWKNSQGNSLSRSRLGFQPAHRLAIHYFGMGRMMRVFSANDASPTLPLMRY